MSAFLGALAGSLFPTLALLFLRRAARRLSDQIETRARALHDPRPGRRPPHGAGAPLNCARCNPWHPDAPPGWRRRARRVLFDLVRFFK